MDYMVVLLGVSVVANGILGAFLLKKKQTLTTDARLLLSELASGSAIIKVAVIDAAGIYYRSPRG